MNEDCVCREQQFNETILENKINIVERTKMNEYHQQQQQTVRMRKTQRDELLVLVTCSMEPHYCV